MPGHSPNPLTLPCTDAFVAKISAATGAVVYATYLGGNTNDGGTGIAVDPVGNVYVTGYTNGDFPVTPNAFSPFPGAGIFVAKLSPDGSRFLYSTHLPGAVPFPGEFKLEAPRTPAPAIAVDAQGNAYVTGPAATGGSFVVKLSPDGSTLLYNKPLNANASDSGAIIAVDAAGNAYITGATTSPDFPATPGAFQTRLAGKQNAFVAKLDASGNVVFATYLGGNWFDQGVAVQADAAGNVYVGGTETSLDFPTTPGTYLPQVLMPPSAIVPGGFAAKLSPDGGTLLYSTYIAGSQWGGGPGVSNMILDPSGGVYLAGVSGPGLAVTASAPGRRTGYGGNPSGPHRRPR